MEMTACRNCHRKCHDAFLCHQCANDLRELLHGLAVGMPLDNGRRSRAWLVALEDAALGDTRLGESARRSTDKTTPIPFGENASALLASMRNMLETWVKHLCEARGMELP